MDVTNEDFLCAIFGSEAGRAHVTGFREDPGKLEELGRRHYWGGGRYSWWRKENLRDPFNSYFAISVFKDDPRDNRAHRRAELHEATYCVVLDDVGTKVDPAALSILPPPSWELETSPGNFQWGFILAEPERDYGRAKALIEGLVARGLSDPATTDVTRYARLPEGRNTKASCGLTGFKCRLSLPQNENESWRSRKVWSGEIAEPLGIVLPEPGTVLRRSQTVKGQKDHLLTLLEEWGMVRGEASSEGWWDIECPWVDEHTDRIDSGTAYRSGGGGDAGAFKCQHGHCAERSRRDLARWVEQKAWAESGGLMHLDEWAFDDVENWEPPHPFKEPAAATAEEEFFADHIFVTSEGRFLCVSADVLIRPNDLDMDWTARLSGVLPVVNKKSGARLAPSKWFVDETQRGRARVATKFIGRPGAPLFFVDETGARCVNEWRQPLRPEVEAEDADVEPWLRLVRHVIGCEGPETVEALLDWFALVVGAPGVKPAWHVLVQSGQGLGKDLIVQPVIAGVGDRNRGTANAKSLHSDFNGWAAKRFVTVNELKQTARGSASGADQYNALKEITEHTNKFVTINRKNREPYAAQNVAAFYVTSNDPEALAIEHDDRRFLVVMAADTRPWPKEDYTALVDWLEAGGTEKCVAWLHARWERMPQSRRAALRERAPETNGKTVLRANVEDPVLTWMREQIESHAWPDLMTGTEITVAVVTAARTGEGGFRYVPGPKKLGRHLRLLGGEHAYSGNSVRLKSDQRVKLWAIREPSRFAGMSETALAQAYQSAHGHTFQESGDVLPFAGKPGQDSGKDDKLPQ